MKKHGKKNPSVQELIGIQGFTEYGLDTDRGELLFFQIAPTNVSVLSPTNVQSRIQHLMMVLSAIPDIEIVCTDYCECFDSNQVYLRQRLSVEDNAKIQELLAQDLDRLDKAQTEMASARQFLFIVRCQQLKPEQVFQHLNRVGKAISDQGFEVLRLGKSEIKRFLAIYFKAGMNGDLLPDVDGAQYFKE